MVATGLDVLTSSGFQKLKGKSVGVLCNQASVSSSLEHILDLLRPLDRSGFLKVAAVFGPQHGLFGHTQDNMIEWEGRVDARTGWHLHSLYGEFREPTHAMLQGIELFIIDLQDVGARYYTFIWTMALCMRACGRAGIPVLVLDRPNPLGGEAVEGTVLQPEFASFVGLHPLPMRHGMTIAEIASYICTYEPCELATERLIDWERSMLFEQTGLPWVMPSPNMPTVDTAVVYPGGCLLEGTNVSEGRGTTRPFEMLGAPGIEGWSLSHNLNARRLAGVRFRPLEFQPTFSKHRGAVCGACFAHVVDRRRFRPILTFLAVLIECYRQWQDFQWKEPPYEYERHKLPIDILSGTARLRSMIENVASLADIESWLDSEVAAFEPLRQRHLLY